jgi:hypothetical protein
MPRALPIVAALVLVIAGGLVRVRWAVRGSEPGAVAAAVARLDRIPEVLGDWRGRPARALQRRVLEEAEIAGYVSRLYEHRRSGAALSLLVVCGRPGPISVHTPDICYSGAGFEPVEPPAKQAIGPGPAEFQMAVFGKPAAAVPTYLRIFWSWKASGSQQWRAPDNPRLAFAPADALYKLYVVRELASATEPIAADPGLEFLQALLPELERALASGKDEG